MSRFWSTLATYIFRKSPLMFTDPRSRSPATLKALCPVAQRARIASTLSRPRSQRANCRAPSASSGREKHVRYFEPFLMRELWACKRTSA
jgi:hypothetical protein